MSTDPTPQNISCLKTLTLNILKNNFPNVIAKDIEISELDSCSRCKEELFLYEFKKPFMTLICDHIFHHCCLEDYIKDLLQCPKYAIEIEFLLVNTAVPMETFSLISSQNQDTISSEAHHISNSSFLNFPLFATYKKQTQKRPSKNITKNKSFSKKPKQNKEKGDKKDSNTIRKLIVELSSNNTEQTISNTNNSYPVTITETDPQPIDFLNLYTKITSVESEDVIATYYSKIISKSGIYLEDGSTGVRSVTNAITIHTYIAKHAKK
ncbi:11715_t:CDS:2 [Cetraspora pellucida]|uniref:11715_t:CDS:1 n=1 Tax=Cetraspora pellucida TaxID=1433469 RepID=A0ACA9KJA3_9GLOM|nr:11715_t:CDS:2 [Cetraspora pellucida]